MKNTKKQYYEAYEDRYRVIHEKGRSWFSTEPTPIVLDVIQRYGIGKGRKILECGCGEGRDAAFLLKNGYDVTGGDISPEAVSWCREHNPEHREKFIVLDCLYGEHPVCYDLIYSAAVLHMLVKDEDRDAFYAFIRNHLKENGIGLVCTMGDGETEFRTDPDEAFKQAERTHEGKQVTVAATSCRMVSSAVFEEEIRRNGLEITEKGLTSSEPEFASLMYAVIKKENSDGCTESDYNQAQHT